ncbi:hypothetical protein NCS52_00792900 [Fusarium sp. LHS14.1]|nr:hypothetical protein NCS52_00792900 [Fusarium sp. LHS14.1]
MAQQIVQGARPRQPLSNLEFRNHRLAAWLHDKVSPWNSAQSFETHGALHALSFPSIAPPDSPLLLGSTSPSSCISDCFTEHHVSVPPPLGLSDPAFTSLMCTGTWFANLPSRPKKSPEACHTDPPPELRPGRRLDATFRERPFDDPDYSEHPSRTIQDPSSEDCNILLNQTFESIASLSGGDGTIQHNAGSKRASGGDTLSTHKPTPSRGASNKRKTPGGSRQRPGKTPDDSSGSGSGTGSGVGSAASQHQNKKPKTSDLRYLCPYRLVYHEMSPQHSFKSCQPPGYISDRSILKRHLRDVHVRTKKKPDLHPDYSMAEDFWDNKVVGIFEKACSKRSKTGSDMWQQKETAFYQEIWKIILPNEPMPKSPFHEAYVEEQSLVDEAVENGQAVSAEDGRPSKEEAVDVTAIAIAELLRIRPELSQRFKDLLRSEDGSHHPPPLTEDTRSPTPAPSNRNHDPSTSHDLPPQTTAVPHPQGIINEVPVVGTDTNQQDFGSFEGMMEIRPETPSGVFQDHPSNTAPATTLHQSRTASRPRMCVCFDIGPLVSEITMRVRAVPGHIGSQKWEITVPEGLVIEEYKQRQIELPFNFEQQTMSENLQPVVPGLDSRLQGSGDGGWSEVPNISPTWVGGAQGTCPDNNFY